MNMKMTNRFVTWVLNTWRDPIDMGGSNLI